MKNFWLDRKKAKEVPPTWVAGVGYIPNMTFTTPTSISVTVPTITVTPGMFGVPGPATITIACPGHYVPGNEPDVIDVGPFSHDWEVYESFISGHIDEVLEE